MSGTVEMETFLEAPGFFQRIRGGGGDVGRRQRVGVWVCSSQWGWGGNSKGGGVGRHERRRTPEIPHAQGRKWREGRFEVGESSAAAAARQTRLDFTHGTDYGFISTLDASIGMREEEAATTHLEVVVEEGDRILAHQLSGKRPRRYRRYFSFVSFDFEREAMYARGAWSRSENRSTALEALIRAQEARITALEAQIMTLQTQHGQMEWQRQEAGDMVTRAFGRIHALEARDPTCLDDLEDTDSSC
ncbi:hypothetical protein Tco_0842565 [Tanacetum coccineum]|uniref:Uncharacterized protein n=1 Tax=Tanacetum coccineum TaxID=301880 RepID=A0ABQ5B3I0_9ASTR